MRLLRRRQPPVPLLQRIAVKASIRHLEALQAFGLEVSYFSRAVQYPQNVRLTLPEGWQVVQVREAKRELRDERGRVRAELLGVGDRPYLYVQRFYDLKFPEEKVVQIVDANGKVHHEIRISENEDDRLTQAWAWLDEHYRWWNIMTQYWD